MLKHLENENIKPTRVVVIGGQGFVGESVINKLSQNGVNCVSVGRKQVDLLEPDAKQKLQSLIQDGDVVVAAAAMAPCKDIVMLRKNLTIVEAIFDGIKQANLSYFLNISSDAVYPDSPVPIDESVPLSPSSFHGIMHFAREIAFRALDSVPSCNVRPSLIYGPGDPHNGYGPNQFVRLTANGNEIKLFGEGEEKRDHVYIEDVGTIIAKCILRKSVGSLNIASGQVVSFRELADTVVQISGNKTEISNIPRLGPMPHNGFRPFNISTCREAFPDFNFTSIVSGIQQTLISNKAKGN